MTSLELTTAPDAAKRSERLAQWTRVLCVLFFFSGFPALIYQLTWQRQLFLIFGVNIESVTIVVTAFMLGLGIGSLAGGWLSKRRGIPPLPLLAAIELMTGAFGVVSLTIFDKVTDWTIGLSLPATAAASLALVIVPTLLMGATLPVLVSHLVRRSGNIGSAVGLLYYVNTLGAGAACLACAVLLFPFLGMSGSIYVAAAMNGTVAIGALVAHWLDGRDPAGSAVGGGQRVKHRGVVRTVTRRLDDHVALDPEVIAQGKQLLLARVARCVLALGREGELVTGTENVTVRVDGPTGQHEAWRAGTRVKDQPVGVHGEGAHH